MLILLFYNLPFMIWLLALYGSRFIPFCSTFFVFFACQSNLPAERFEPNVCHFFREMMIPMRNKILFLNFLIADAQSIFFYYVSGREGGCALWSFRSRLQIWPLNLNKLQLRFVQFSKKKKHLKQKYVLLDINSVCESGLSIYFFFKSDFRV